MRVWLLTVGEPLPTDAGSERLLRTGILARTLADQGHDVLWWTSVFNHALKQKRFDDERSIEVASNYRIQLLQGGGYSRNISFERLRDHRRLAARFATLAPSFAAPDVILSSVPLLELSLAAVEYGNERGIPVVLDVRDLWPDIFLEMFPKVLRPLGAVALRPMRNVVRHACAGATAIWGHAPAFVEWGLMHAGRPRSPADRDFPFGYESHAPADEEIEEAHRMWASHGLTAQAGDLIACFIGAIGHQFRLDTAIQAVHELRGEPGIKVVLCGTGDRLESLRGRARGLENVVLPGWRRRAEIWTLLRLSSLGLAPYVDRFDYAASIPNKVPEYLSAGLPIALSLRAGYLHDLLLQSGCGQSYAGSPSQLAALMVSLRDDRARLAAMSAAATSLFESRFRAEHVYADMAAALTRIGRDAREGDRLASSVGGA